MGRKPIRKAEQLMKQLSKEDRERVVEFAERLANDAPSSSSSQESLTQGNEPSYLALADELSYTTAREEIERNVRPDPRG